MDRPEEPSEALDKPGRWGAVAIHQPHSHRHDLRGLSCGGPSSDGRLGARNCNDHQSSSRLHTPDTNRKPEMPTFESTNPDGFDLAIWRVLVERFAERPPDVVAVYAWGGSMTETNKALAHALLAAARKPNTLVVAQPAFLPTMLDLTDDGDPIVELERDFVAEARAALHPTSAVLEVAHVGDRYETTISFTHLAIDVGRTCGAQSFTALSAGPQHADIQRTADSRTMTVSFEDVDWQWERSDRHIQIRGRAPYTCARVARPVLLAVVPHGWLNNSPDRPATVHIA